MITREPTTFHLSSTDLCLSKQELVDRLWASGHWSERQLVRVTEMDIGDSTDAPVAFYTINGVRHASVNGVVGKPLA